ncbi:uncharacterized protein [Nicotiana sylvestris]|uniref:uncharacterized protein n=1 Tax=Nicotiana sylvestris TaxID=4096 RepID=UPI00388C3AF3
MEFARLSKYAIHMLPTMEARVRRFVQCLNPLIINEASTTALNSDRNYRKMVEFAQATENRKLKNKMEREGSKKTWAQLVAVESFQARSGQQGILSAVSVIRERSQQQRSPCPRCRKLHSGISYLELPICYGCGIRGHIQRHCRASFQGAVRGTAQPSSPAAASSSAPSLARGTPAPAGRDAPRGGAQSSGGPSQLYAMSDRQTVEASLDVVTGILTVQYHDVYALIDPGFTLSYVTPFVAIEFGIEPD